MSDRQRQCVLVVDDEKFNRRILADLLMPDYVVILAKDGVQALERAEAEPLPDLILLDVVMDGMSGYEVLRRLRDNERTASIPVMFVTGLGGEDDEERGLELGAVDYIAKPFRAAIVKARVRNHLDYVWQRKRLEQHAHIDALTKIANRRRFDEVFPCEFRRSARNGSSLSLALLDVDHFKQFNDVYGHGAGDAALAAVAQVISQHAARPFDLAVRYGGEEFVVLLPETSEEGAVAAAERIRADVEGLGIHHAGSTTAPCLTVSIGGAAVVPGPDASSEAVIELADRNLYVAKRQGRNRVVWSSA